MTTVSAPQPNSGTPEPRRQGPPEVEALHAIDRIIGNETRLGEHQLGEVRGIVLDTLNAWHVRQREAPPGQGVALPEAWARPDGGGIAVRLPGPHEQWRVHTRLRSETRNEFDTTGWVRLMPSFAPVEPERPAP